MRLLAVAVKFQPYFSPKLLKIIVMVKDIVGRQCTSLVFQMQIVTKSGYLQPFDWWKSLTKQDTNTENMRPALSQYLSLFHGESQKWLKRIKCSVWPDSVLNPGSLASSSLVMAMLFWLTSTSHDQIDQGHQLLTCEVVDRPYHINICADTGSFLPSTKA